MNSSCSLEYDGILLKHHLIHPGVCVKPNVEADCEVEAGVPVDQHQDVEHDLQDAEGVGEVGAGLGLVEELEHPLYLGDPVEPHDDVAGDLVVALPGEQEVEEVRGQDADQVLLEPHGLPVGGAEQLGVLDHDSLIEVTLVSSDEDVHDVEEVAAVVEDDPAAREDVLQLPEARPPDDEDEVVHDGEVDDDQPLVVVILPVVKRQVSTDASI